MNTTKTNNIVYIISDFKCSTCRKTESKIKKIIDKFKDKIEFRFVYHSSYIDKCALAVEAASKQENFLQMHDQLFKKDLSDNKVYNEIAKKLDIDIDKFNNDMNNNNILKKLTENRELLISKDVYSTPTFIVNTKLLDGKYAVDYLEKIIENELK